MNHRRIPIGSLLAPLLLSVACAYIVLPEGLEAPSSAESKGWRAIPTNVGTTETGDLHVDLALLNETGDWSAMQAEAGAPAVLHRGRGPRV